MCVCVCVCVRACVRASVCVCVCAFKLMHYCYFLVFISTLDKYILNILKLIKWSQKRGGRLFTKGWLACS